MESLPAVLIRAVDHLNIVAIRTGAQHAVYCSQITFLSSQTKIPAQVIWKKSKFK